MMRNLPVALFIAFASGADGAELLEGAKFPLFSGDAVPTMMRVEVQRITSDNTVDVQVWLNAPTVAPTTMPQLLVQLGEFCLRYYQDILDAAVPKEEHARIYVFVPLYMVPVPGSTNRFEQHGFAFQQQEGRCSLATPFPQELVAKVELNAGQPLTED